MAGTSVKRGMTTFVSTIFMLGLIIAAAYVVIAHPGDTTQQSVSKQASKALTEH